MLTPKLRAVLARRWILLLVIPLATAVVVWFITPANPPDREERFRAEQTILTQLDSGVTSFSSTAQASLFATTGAVPETAAATLGFEGDPEELARDLDVATDEETFSITLSTEAEDPEEATAYVAAFSGAFIDVVNQQSQAAQDQAVNDLRAEREALTQELSAFNFSNAEALADPATAPPALVEQQGALESQIDSLNQQVDAALAQGAPAATFQALGAEPAEAVQPPTISVPQSRAQRVALAVPFALALAIGLVFLLEQLHRRIDTRSDLDAVSSVPLLAEIPVNPDADFQRYEQDPDQSFEGPFAEAYRSLRSSLEYLAVSGGHDGPQVIMVVSGVPGEGKSTTSAHLAMAFAEKGQQVVVLGCDFRRPTIHRIFGVPSEPGLAELVSRPGLEPRDVVYPSGSTGVWVAPSGRRTSIVAPLVAAAGATVAWAKEQGRTVIIDTAPVLAANDAADLFPLVDQVVVVIRAGLSLVSAVESVHDLLSQYDVPTVGHVLVDSPAQQRSNYFYRYYGYDDSEPGREVENEAPGPVASTGAAVLPPPTPPPPPPPPPDTPTSEPAETSS